MFEDVLYLEEFEGQIGEEDEDDDDDDEDEEKEIA